MLAQKKNYTWPSTRWPWMREVTQQPTQTQRHWTFVSRKQMSWTFARQLYNETYDLSRPLWSLQSFVLYWPKIVLNHLLGLDADPDPTGLKFEPVICPYYICLACNDNTSVWIYRPQIISFLLETTCSLVQYSKYQNASSFFKASAQTY